MQKYTFKTVDHPEANGRSPQPQEFCYWIIFTLEDGVELEVKCGSSTFDRFVELIHEYEEDIDVDLLDEEGVE